MRPGGERPPPRGAGGMPSAYYVAIGLGAVALLFLCAGLVLRIAGY